MKKDGWNGCASVGRHRRGSGLDQNIARPMQRGEPLSLHGLSRHKTLGLSACRLAYGSALILSLLPRFTYGLT